MECGTRPTARTTTGRFAAGRLLIALLAAGSVLAACTQQPPPPPPAGVLLDLNANDRSYTLFLVHTDGSVVAANAHQRTIRSFVAARGGALPAPMPAFSVTNDRVYYLDGDNDVRWVDSRGNRSNGVVLTVPGSPFTESGIGVSPDDRFIAVATVDYAQNPQTSPPSLALPATLVVSVGSFAPHSGHTIFRATATVTAPTTRFLWPAGWFPNLPVMAIGEAATQNVAYNPYGTFTGYSYLTATTGSPVGGMLCVPAGPLTPAGTACLYSFATLSTHSLSTPYPARTPPTPLGAAISPNGQHVAYCCTAGALQLWQLNMSPPSRPLLATPGPTEGWIDDNHALTEGTTASHAQVIDIRSTTARTAPAIGTVVGRLPGGL
jgi:hypothetical protein